MRSSFSFAHTSTNCKSLASNDAHITHRPVLLRLRGLPDLIVASAKYNCSVPSLLLAVIATRLTPLLVPSLPHNLALLGERRTTTQGVCYAVTVPGAVL
jgi:hypothetical protein